MRVMTQREPVQIRRDTPVKQRKSLSSRLLSRGAYLYLAPAYLLMFGVIGFPVIKNIISSFFVIKGEDSVFVGLQQYVQLFQAADFYNALLLTLYWTLAVTIFQFVAGLLVAILINHEMAIMRWLKPLLILPWALPGIIAATSWVFLYSPQGPIDSLLQPFIPSPPSWLADPAWAMPAVIVAGIWKGFPFYMLMLLAGLQTIPTELLEAALLDGATFWQSLRYVMLPMLRPVITTSLILGVIWTSNYFDGIYLMTQGGPAAATQTLPIWIYNVAFSQFDLNRAATISVVLLVLVLSLLTLYFRGQGEEL